MLKLLIVLYALYTAIALYGSIRAGSFDRGTLVSVALSVALVTWLIRQEAKRKQDNPSSIKGRKS